MTRSGVYVAIVVATIVAGGGYYVITKTEILAGFDGEASTTPATTHNKPSGKPLHGEFHKRFQPSLPPPDGGSGSKSHGSD